MTGDTGNTLRFEARVRVIAKGGRVSAASDGQIQVDRADEARGAAGGRHDSITGLRARGGFNVDLAWKEGKLTEAHLRSEKGGVTKVRYVGRTLDLRLAPDQATRLDPSHFNQPQP